MSEYRSDGTGLKLQHAFHCATHWNNIHTRAPDNKALNKQTNKQKKAMIGNEY